MTSGGLERGSALERGVRGGLVVYGVVHLIIAAIALEMVFGSAGGKTASQSGAFAQLAQESWGQAVLFVMAAGFALLVVWQAIEAFGSRDEDSTGKRIFKIGAHTGRAVVYAVLGWNAASTALSGGSSGKSTDSMTARLMSAPGGQLLVGAVGLAIVAVGGYLVVKGIRQKFTKQLEPGAVRGDRRRAVLGVGVAGHVGKGVALGAVGVLFVIAAAQHEADKSGGLDAALHSLLRQPFGPVLTALVALGIGCYGLYCFVWARHLRH